MGRVGNVSQLLAGAAAAAVNMYVLRLDHSIRQDEALYIHRGRYSRVDARGPRIDHPETGNGQERCLAR